MKEAGKKKIFGKEDSRELGFGNTESATRRLLNKNGEFNLKRTGLRFTQRISAYHDLIDMPWPGFIGLIFSAYFIINLIFAFLYYQIGTVHLAGIDGKDEWTKFSEAFFFSAQSLTTVGYGRISPTGFWASLIASIEAMTGLLGFAIITGLLYGKFTRPNARIMFTSSAVISPYKQINAFMFRIVNQRRNQLLEVEVQVVLAFNQESGGKKNRVFIQLGLENNKINFFPLPWTIVHPINEESPLAGWTEKEMEESDAEFIILVKAYDDSFSQNVYRRYSYTYKEVKWGAKYPIIWEKDQTGKTLLHLEKLNDTVEAPLNREISESNSSE
jgi:inward rectifier potassium channel